MNNHYVLINSGLPWWTPAKPKDGGQSGSFSFLSSKADNLKNLKDFVFFREYSDNIVSEGYFDNDWKIPAEEAAKLKSSGAVSIKE
jgi:hypothetical protein